LTKSGFVYLRGLQCIESSNPSPPPLVKWLVEVFLVGAAGSQSEFSVLQIAFQINRHVLRPKGHEAHKQNRGTEAEQFV
jgi:hypothetical protein